MTRALAFAALLACAAPAAAHDFYSAQCCRSAEEHGGDCAPVPDGAVKFTASGWLYQPTGDVVPFAKALLSPDGRFHVCLPHSTGAHVRCLYSPQPAS